MVVDLHSLSLVNILFLKSRNRIHHFLLEYFLSETLFFIASVRIEAMRLKSRGMLCFKIHTLMLQSV
jgi:hypothetical protein